ncbi:hypothetical protein [Metabacillus malikii]|uniref:Uncharacterized protein n=1 Tax=Metabacillus malikii TaxID=1504265 RepID=A0ABT9ZCI8_9BACI|nr:hypothetical protein [Metabacillus malikii]MDQ0229952.1 hypothetical protein [Metabacillus malikii]
MLKYIMILLIFIVIYALEAPKLIKNKEKKELLVFSFLLIVGLSLSFVAVLQGFM